MKNSLFDEDGNVSLTIKLEIPVKDLEKVIEDVVIKTTEILMTKFKNE
ncbi:hypothetical protein SAMN05444280_1376 [Tangfeifania diversioriginum]|uniref:Uncharacterized protein n=1 Tax=Tangfeifania diversioriginum TaxID=1168035 RepID=A0A1M6MXG2_9BACT|nr:hypothetical protein [Tangfeifania diversioriginum]SHJ88112.1 hypothetical protein SAMN05444280_1376 [Tangfeifania diversioriginum]